MAHRRTTIQAANDIAAQMLMQCGGEVSPRVHRFQVANLVLGEFAEMAARIEGSIREHGEITPTCFRYLRENLGDLARSVIGAHGEMPTSDAGTSLAAD